MNQTLLLADAPFSVVFYESACGNFKKPTVLAQHTDNLLDWVDISNPEIGSVVIDMESFARKFFSGLGVPVVLVAKAAQKSSALA